MARKKIVQDSKGNPVELDQDAIEAALAGAVTNADGSHPKQEKPHPQDERKNPEPVVETPVEETESDEKLDVKFDPCETQAVGETPTALSQQEFVKACYDLTINAKQCKYQSSKVEDKSIVEYIRSINKKIYDETQKGGYSTNVQFRVTPQDWVNVNHIFDWYKIRGFQVEIKETTTAPYGKEVGTMNYNFTISWSEA